MLVYCVVTLDTNTSKLLHTIYTILYNAIQYNITQCNTIQQI